MRLDDLIANPDLFPQQLDLASRRLLFLTLDEQRLRDAPFLDNRVLAAGMQGAWVPLDALGDRQPTARSPDPSWIFHIGHCGSTLLSRLLPQIGPLLPIREPPALRTLAQARRRLDSGESGPSTEDWDRTFDLLLSLYSRSYRAGEAALIKATSDCSNLVVPALKARPGSKAVLMYVSLDRYLSTMIVEGAPRPDIEGHAATRLMDLEAFMGAPDEVGLTELGPAQRVVVSWLSGIAWLHQAKIVLGDRVMTLDFDDLLSDGRGALRATASFLDLPIDDGAITDAIEGPVMRTYAKAPDHPYTPASRAAQLAENYARSSGLIDEGLRWADALIEGDDSLREAAKRFPVRGASDLRPD